MLYKLIKQIPNIGDVNDILDSDYWKWINFSEKSYFIEYVKPLYPIGTHLIFNRIHYKVIDVNESTMLMTLRPVSSYGGDKLIPVDTIKDIKVINFFWFINSSGAIQCDYEERANISKYSIAYKKKTNNFFLTKEAAVAALESLNIKL